MSYPIQISVIAAVIAILALALNTRTKDHGWRDQMVLGITTLASFTSLVVIPIWWLQRFRPPMGWADVVTPLVVGLVFGAFALRKYRKVS